MALIDVAAAFDLSFLSDGELIHTTATLDDEGVFRQVDSERETLRAVFIPSGTEKVSGAVENELKVKALDVYIPRKRASIQTRIAPADVIIFDGQRYNVTEVTNYHYYGAGYVLAKAELTGGDDVL